MRFSTPPPRSALRWGSSAADATSVPRLLQVRLSLYTRLMSTLFGVMYVGGAVVVAIFAPAWFVRVHEHPAKVINLLLFFGFGAMYLFLRGRDRAMTVLQVLDAGSIALLSAGVGIGVATAPGGFHFELAALLIFIIPLVLRAAIVPSTAVWTVLVGTLGTPAILLGSYVQVAKAPVAGFLSPQVIVIGLAMWSVVSTVATAVVSHVIYGLVAQVQEAMRLGQYTLRDKLGEGGMGAVYRAEHAMLRRATAVKLLLPERIGAESLARFEREVQLTSQLSHPNTISIYDYGKTPEGVFYYAMEYLEGRTLEKLVEESGPQEPGRVVHLLAQVAGALREAHGVGLIHRDIKPSNVLLCTRGGIPEFVKVIDFGLVKRLDGGEDVTVTRLDVIAGTPLFMAPESLVNPERVDAAIDVYALGGLAYFLLTGGPPFTGQTIVEVCSHHLHTPPTPPSLRLGRPLPAKLEALVLRCLAKNPDDRPDDEELRRLLGECREESPFTAEYAA